jgi:hypothetical protein
VRFPRATRPDVLGELHPAAGARGRDAEEIGRIENARCACELTFSLLRCKSWWWVRGCREARVQAPRGDGRRPRSGARSDGVRGTGRWQSRPLSREVASTTALGVVASGNLADVEAADAVMVAGFRPQP